MVFRTMLNAVYDRLCSNWEWDCINELTGVVDKEGFGLMAYNVITPDGFLLTLHRLHNPKMDRTLRPVLLQHGILNCSAEFLMPGGLAYAIARSGRDVWLGNFRGNLFSRNHFKFTCMCSGSCVDSCELSRRIRELRWEEREDSNKVLSSLRLEVGGSQAQHWDHHKVIVEMDDEDAWNFSFHEHGTLDLPPMVQKVVDVTGFDRIHYVGHSMGTTALFVMADQVPEMAAQHIESAVLLAPVAHLGLVSGLPSLLLNLTDRAMDAMEGMPLHSPLVPMAMRQFGLVNRFFLHHLGYHELYSNKLAEVACFSPTGASTKAIKHFIKCHKSGGVFRHYEDQRSGCRANHSGYDPNNNGWPDPRRPRTPADGRKCVYEFKNMTFPVKVYWAQADWASGPENVARIVAELPNLVMVERLANPYCGHMDFLWGCQAEFYEKLALEMDDVELSRHLQEGLQQLNTSKSISQGMATAHTILGTYILPVFGLSL